MICVDKLDICINNPPPPKKKRGGGVNGKYIFSYYHVSIVSLRAFIINVSSARLAIDRILGQAVKYIYGRITQFSGGKSSVTALPL